MRTIMLAIGGLLAASTAPALAQDMAAGYGGAPSASFTGPRAEIFGGWDRIGSRLRTYSLTEGRRTTVRDHRDGFVGGMQLGYDLPVGHRFVAGVFGSVALSSARACADGQGCFKARRELEAGARFGTKLMDDRALAYLKGAYINGRFRDTTLDLSGNRDGWRVGAGVEYAFTPHVYTKLEYDYTRFEKIRPEVGIAPASIEFNRNQVLAGFGIRF